MKAFDQARHSLVVRNLQQSPGEAGVRLGDAEQIAFGEACFHIADDRAAR